jgi:hypothetical protein
MSVFSNPLQGEVSTSVFPILCICKEESKDSLHIPMLTCNDISILDHRLKLLKNRSSEAFSEHMQLFYGSIQLRQMLPTFIVALNVVLMQL